MGATKKVSIITLGCAKNVSDTDSLKRVLNARGYQVIDDASKSDAIVVHTCSFIEAAKKESVDTILKATQFKTAGKKLIVTGCMVQQHGPELFDELPEVDAFLGTGQLGQIPDLLARSKPRFLDRANPGGFVDPDVSTFAKAESATATIRLSEGCSHPCTFCVIPRLRGPVQARPRSAIVQEVASLAEQGVEELVVIGQDTGDWGRFSKDSLPDLLRAMAAVKGIRWIRLMYMHPASFSMDLLQVLAENPSVFPYLDMPFQHIDSDVLRLMHRKSDEKMLRGLLETIKKRAPALSLRTTFIVGFPGETDPQFKKLLDFVREGLFDYLGAFTYSQEEGTPAARRDDQIPDPIKKDRLSAVTDAHFYVSEIKARKRLGTLETVILEDDEEDFVLGRTAREAPEIDAIVRLARPAARGGRFIQAKITAYDAYEFTATAL